MPFGDTDTVLLLIVSLCQLDKTSDNLKIILHIASASLFCPVYFMYSCKHFCALVDRLTVISLYDSFLRFMVIVSFVLSFFLKRGQQFAALDVGQSGQRRFEFRKRQPCRRTFAL